MVQVIETEDPRSKIGEMLGMSLGQGIGNGLNTFFANRSLESVLQDKALEGAPQSKKLQALQTALGPYGEKGQDIFNQRMQIEQLEQQELQQQKQESLQRYKGKALGKYLKGGDLTEDEESLFTPQEFVSMHKARNVAKKPVPESEQQKVIGRERGKEIAHLEKEIPKMQGIFKDLDKLEELSKDFKGPFGYLGAKSGLNKSSNEFDTIALTRAEPILKLFNPVGAIPVTKMKIVVDKTTPKSTDIQSVIDGKVSALRYYAMRGLEEAQERLNLLRNGASSEEISNFDRKSADEIDGLENLADSQFDIQTLVENLIREAGSVEGARELAAKRGLKL